MKVLIVHNAYQNSGGEDAVVRNETLMLKARGHDVSECIVDNRDISGVWSKICAAFGSIFSVTKYRRMMDLLRREAPDVVHVHNFFPLISPSVFYACRRRRVPSVLTLHNYRIVCPTAVLMHRGQIDERSLVSGPWWAVRERVYRGSLLGTFVLACGIWTHKRIGTWSKYVSRFVVLTTFAAEKFVVGGLSRSSMVVKPNFVDIAAPAEDGPRQGFLFVGRLSEEKGVDVLIEALRHTALGVEVRIAGSGPMARGMEGAPGVAILGAVESKVVYREMVSALALVIPSRCYEGFPLVLVEAFACGLPVIASRIGALAELIEDGVSGLLFDPGSASDLAVKMEWAVDHPEAMARMGQAARARYEELYTEERNYSQLTAIYRDAISAMEDGGRA